MTKTKKVSFKCSNPACGQPVYDPLYRGPLGHSPVDMCYECWLEHWELHEAKRLNGGNWTDLDQILWLICRGVNQSDAASIVGRNRNLVRIWIRKMRNNPQLIPEWLLKKATNGL